MKNKSRLGFFLAMCLGSFSCSRFLEENPKDKLPGDDVYNAISEVYLDVVASLYTYVSGYSDSQGLQGAGRGVHNLNTFTSDEAIIPVHGGDWYGDGFWRGFHLHDRGIENDVIQATWEYLYKIVMLNNESLERIDEFVGTHSATELPVYHAEVRAMQAVYYYYLMDLFGRIPLVQSSSVAMKDVVQSERKTVLDFVVRELQETAPLLSDTHSNQSGSYYGHITRPVVTFLLTKLILGSEVYTDDDWADGQRLNGRSIRFTMNGSELNAWETVIYYCDQLKTMSYKLEPEYETNFSIFNEPSVGNILTIPMNKALHANQMQYLFRSRHYNHAKAYGLSGESGSSTTVEALGIFGYETAEQDPRFDICYFTGVIHDPRRSMIELDNGVILEYPPWKVSLGTIDTLYEQAAGAHIKKYEVDPTVTKDGKLAENDTVLFRYVDALLMRSGAKIRDGANEDEEPNEVRDRVSTSPHTTTSENILAERQLGLVWEGRRRQNLVRFGKLTRAYSNRPRLSDEASGYTTVFPMSEKIRVVSERLKQNPGY